jgi:hypothetical protein
MDGADTVGGAVVREAEPAELLVEGASVPVVVLPVHAPRANVAAATSPAIAALLFIPASSQLRFRTCKEGCAAPSIAPLAHGWASVWLPLTPKSGIDRFDLLYKLGNSQNLFRYVSELSDRDSIYLRGIRQESVSHRPH